MQTRSGDETSMTTDGRIVTVEGAGAGAGVVTVEGGGAEAEVVIEPPPGGESDHGRVTEVAAGRKKRNQ